MRNMVGSELVAWVYAPRAGVILVRWSTKVAESRYGMEESAKTMDVAVFLKGCKKLSDVLRVGRGARMAEYCNRRGRKSRH